MSSTVITNAERHHKPTKCVTTLKYSTSAKMKTSSREWDKPQMGNTTSSLMQSVNADGRTLGWKEGSGLGRQLIVGIQA